MSEPHTDGDLGITKGRVGWMKTSTWSILWSGVQKAESNSGSLRGEAKLQYGGQLLSLSLSSLPSLPQLFLTYVIPNITAADQPSLMACALYCFLSFSFASKNTGYPDLQSLWLGLLRDDTVLCYSSLRNLPPCVDDMYTHMFFSWRFPESYLCAIHSWR